MIWHLYFTHTAISKKAKISIPAEKGAKTRIRIAANAGYVFFTISPPLYPA